MRKFKKTRDNRFRLSMDEIRSMNLPKANQNRYLLSDDQQEQLKLLREGEVKSHKKGVTPEVKENAPAPFVLSAWNFNTGKMMDIDEYCSHYNLPRQDIKDYKLITHTGTPYYNTKFKDNDIDVSEIDFEAIVENTCLKVMKDYKRAPVVSELNIKQSFDRLIYTDVHIGMDTDSKGKAMYATPWNEEEMFRRLEIMADVMIEEQTGHELIIQDLGDFMDGWNGETTRGGHKLPQNMSNEEAYDVGVRFKVALVDMLYPHYAKITCSNICNDNHAGSFGHIVNKAFADIIKIKYEDVIVHNHKQFIDHYIVGDHAFVVTHGKDDAMLKFGFKPMLDPKQIEKIDQYLKVNGIYNKAKYIEFSKGDSHQALFDYCSSDDFDYCNYPAMSPSSEWVQTNFKKGRSGFVIQNIEYNSNYKNITPYFFSDEE